MFTNQKIKKMKKFKNTIDSDIQSLDNTHRKANKKAVKLARQKARQAKIAMTFIN